MDDFDKVMAEISREFYEGLSERLAAICSALDTLDNGFDGDAAHLFMRTAHSLKGGFRLSGRRGTGASGVWPEPPGHRLDRGRRNSRVGDGESPRGPEGVVRARPEAERRLGHPNA